MKLVNKKHDKSKISFAKMIFGNIYLWKEEIISYSRDTGRITEFLLKVKFNKRISIEKCLLQIKRFHRLYEMGWDIYNPENIGEVPWMT